MGYFFWGGESVDPNGLSIRLCQGYAGQELRPYSPGRSAPAEPGVGRDLVSRHFTPLYLSSYDF